MTEKVIREVIAFRDSAKIQQIGKGYDGNPKFMVYLTPIVKRAGWGKGDKIIIEAYKLTETEQVERNPYSKVIKRPRNVPEAERLDDNAMQSSDTATHSHLVTTNDGPGGSPERATSQPGPSLSLKKNEDGTQEVVSVEDRQQDRAYREYRRE